MAAFSESIGPLNALFAATAALAAFAALDAQKKENSALAARAANDQLSTERRDFESTFFKLVELLRATVNETQARHPHQGFDDTGRQAFQMILERVGPTSGTDEGDRDRWKAIYFEYHPQLGHYFRLLYQILRFIDDSSMPDKMLYARFVRATLSNPEIVLLGLNSWHGEYPKTKILVNRYSMLHNISTGEAVTRRFHRYFKKSAFGDRDLVAEQKYSGPTK